MSCPRFLSSPPDLEGQRAAAGAVPGLFLPPLDAKRKRVAHELFPFLMKHKGEVKSLWAAGSLLCPAPE